MIAIEPLDESLARRLAERFRPPQWNRAAGYVDGILAQQNRHDLSCLVASVDREIAGYCKIVWSPAYIGLREAGLPEIQDLNVLAEFRRRGVATRLLDEAEALAARRFDSVGIGVGLHPGYNAAQRLYVLRGYVPDARGVTYRDEFVAEGDRVSMDDDLVLHFVKTLSSNVSRS